MSSLRLFAVTNYELSAADGGDGMKRSNGSRMRIAAALSTVAVVFLATQLMAQVASLDPAKMPTIGTVDERFQSYNIEMVEVIGGRFWKPYANTKNESKAQGPAPQAVFTPAGIDPNLYRYRAPVDLSNPRLRKLAAALSPAYVRVSGTWANSAYFQDSDNAAPANAPAGFSGVLTRQEWKGVIDFSHVVNAEIVTSVATGPGPRDAQGVWTSEQARELFEYTKSVGGRIAASEFMNEPTFAVDGRRTERIRCRKLWPRRRGVPFVPSKNSARYTISRSRFSWRGTVRNTNGWRSAEIRRPASRSRSGIRRFFVPSLCRYFAAVCKHGRIITDNGSSGTFSRLALATGKDWHILRGSSRQVRTGQITLDYGNRRCSLRWKPLGVDFSGHLPISCSTCKPRPAWRESDYAQHTGIKRLWLVRRKYIRTTPELLGRFALATTHGYDSSRSTDSINSESLCLCALSAEPFRWRRALGHQCRRTTSP